MDLKSGTLLVPPTLKNSSCSHPRYLGYSFMIHVGITETVEALVILLLTLGVVGANSLVIIVINNRRYSKYIYQQPRYLLTSLALNDLAIGLFVMPFGFLPALFNCWPYGEIFCQIQALLRGALSQQSAVILVCMAVDRYVCALHPRRYYQHSSKKGCVAILSFTWIISLIVFGFIVLPKGYHFNNTGLMACEPFYAKPSYRILATCALYFPTTMVLMYSYGSSFHMSRFRLNDATLSNMNCFSKHPLMSSTTVPNTPFINLSMAVSMGLSGISGPANTITKKITPIQGQQSRNGAISKSMAAISLGFIVMVTPWTIQEIVTACTGSKLPPFLDFIVTWTALSNSFWNPFLYWLLNSHFRHLSHHLLPNWLFPVYVGTNGKDTCCQINTEIDTNALPIPPEPPITRPPFFLSGVEGFLSTNIHTLPPKSHQQDFLHNGCHRPDIEGLSEKYWGEILERTVSSSSLHALQKSLVMPYQEQHVTTSFSNTSDSNLTICEKAEDGSNKISALEKSCNSEPELFEHFNHEAGCAQNIFPVTVLSVEPKTAYEINLNNAHQ